MTLVNFNNRPVTKTINNVFDELLNNYPNVWGKEVSAVPPVNITETTDAYNLVLNVPGRSKEDFKVNIDNGLLTISYEKKTEVTAENTKNIRKEFSFQSFKRSFSLDEKVNVEKIEAKYENGLLHFHLPKKEQVNTTQQITIQ